MTFVFGLTLLLLEERLPKGQQVYLLSIIQYWVKIEPSFVRYSFR